MNIWNNHENVILDLLIVGTKSNSGNVISYNNFRVNIYVNICAFLMRVFQYAISSSAGMSSSLEVIITSLNSEMSLRSMVLK